MAEATSTVIVIDDDPAIRDSIGSLLRSVGLQAKLHASVDEFLKTGRPDGPACLVLDVRLPGRSGLDFQRELAAANIHLPIIFITGYGDIPMSVTAMKGGAIEFLAKPFALPAMLQKVRTMVGAQHRAAPPVQIGKTEAATAGASTRYRPVLSSSHSK